jgi:hypothetical protein
MLEAAEVYSISRCAFCKPLKKRSYKEALLDAKGFDKLGSVVRFTNVILEIYTMMSTTTTYIVMMAACFTVILIIYNAIWSAVLNARNNSWVVVI